MSTSLVSPIDERVREPVTHAARLPDLAGRRIALLDISKPRGDVFLDRVEELLGKHHDVAEVVRFKKPTHTRPAPAPLAHELSAYDAVVEALAD